MRVIQPVPAVFPTDHGQAPACDTPRGKLWRWKGKANQCLVAMETSNLHFHPFHSPRPPPPAGAAIAAPSHRQSGQVMCERTSPVLLPLTSRGPESSVVLHGTDDEGGEKWQTARHVWLDIRVTSPRDKWSGQDTVQHTTQYPVTLCPLPVHSTPGAIPLLCPGPMADIKLSQGAGSQARPAAPTSKTKAVQHWGSKDGPGGLASPATTALSPADLESWIGTAS